MFFYSSAGPPANVEGSGLWPSTFLESYFCHWGFPGILILCHCLRYLKYSWYIHFHNLVGDLAELYAQQMFANFDILALYKNI